MSKEYIERSKVIEVIKNYGKGAIEDGQKTLDPVDDILLIQGAVGMIRSANVVEVVHAEWKVDSFPEHNKKFITCSHCDSVIDCSKGYIDENEYDYCPYCSAKMDGERKEN